jgi:RNA polymerase-binding transcription factor DksA
LAKAREALLRRRQDLLSQAAEEVTPAQINMADVGTDEYDRDWALAMASSEQELLYEIDQALNRIRNGTYGLCEVTGKPIEPERLTAIPWTRFSAEAEQRLEADGQATRARLGKRETVKRESAEQGPE